MIRKANSIDAVEGGLEAVEVPPNVNSENVANTDRSSEKRDRPNRPSDAELRLSGV